MTHSNQSNYRFFLLLVFRILVFIGFLFIITPFIISLFDGTNSVATNNNQYLTVKLADIKSGEIKKIKVGYIPVWIYKRRKNEIEQLEGMAPLLADPKSQISTQPVQLRTVYRSYDQYYFIFRPIESLKSCNIRYLNKPNTKLALLLSENNLSWQGGFTESCYGSIYDLSGRVYQGTGNKEQKNLSVPEYTIQQGDVIQFEITTMVMNK